MLRHFARFGGLFVALLLTMQAHGAPPAMGTSYRFADTVLGGSVVCDTLDQVASIVRAADPAGMVRLLFALRNGKNEPVCSPLMFTASMVLEARPVGRTELGGKPYEAVAVKVSIGSVVAWVLWLEPVPIVFV